MHAAQHGRPATDNGEAPEGGLMEELPQTTLDEVRRWGESPCRGTFGAPFREHTEKEMSR